MVGSKCNAILIGGVNGSQQGAMTVADAVNNGRGEGCKETRDASLKNEYQMVSNTDPFFGTPSSVRLCVATCVYIGRVWR